MAVAAYSSEGIGAAKEEQRFRRSSLFVVLFAVTLLLLGIGFRIYRFTLPTEGWSFRTDFFEQGLIFDQNLSGVPSPFQKGDLLLDVAGVNLFQVFAFQAKPAEPGVFRVGNTVAYRVQRGEQTLSLETELHHWTARGLTNALAQILLNRVPHFSPFLLLQLALVVFVFVKRPGNLAAQILLLMFATNLASGVNWIVAGFSPADAFDPVAREATDWLAASTNPILFVPLFVHLALIFPRPKWGFDSLRRAVLLLYSPPVILTMLWKAKLIANILDYLVPFYFLVMLVAFLHSLLTIEDPVMHAQMKWLAYAGAIWAWVGLISFSNDLWFWLPPIVSGLLNWVSVELLWVLCLTIAILNHRLFDIDLIINRTLVYGVLTAGVVSFYALVVGGFGQLLNMQDDLGLSLFATGLVAVAFHPLRQRLQRAANRLLYGERDEPFAVLSKLGQSIEGTLEPARLLPAITETVAQVLNLPYAGVVLSADDASELVASYGRPKGEWAAFPLRHQGEQIGEMRLEPRAGERFKPAELKLLKTIAQQASVAAFALKQTLDLQRSREALVTAREEERLRIRRDLHDGLGPELAGLALKLDAARNLLTHEPAETDRLLLELKSQAQGAVADIRRLVYDLRPPALDQLGLEGAIREQVNACAGELNATLSLEGELSALPAAAEVACYRIVQEALTNVLRHARASALRVRIARGARLELWVEDNGVGLPEAFRAGVGLRSMRERAEELGGSFSVETLSTGGTRVTATLPVSTK